MSTPSVGIIGGGIGGLTAAVALARQGIRARVYEQASHYVPTAGAGFGFSPNGQVCLASLGIETRSMLHRFDKLVHLNREGVVKVESDLFAQIKDRHGFTVCGCLRADLVKKLSNSLDHDCLKYSHKLVSIEQDSEKVLLNFDGRDDVEHDLVIGADGINSTVAEQLGIDHSPPVFSGACIYYGIIEDPDNVDFDNQLLAQDHAVIQGPGTGEFISFRVGPDNRKLQIWASTYTADAPPPREEWGAADLTSPDLTSMLGEYPSSHPIHELASRTTPGRLLHFGLFFRKHKESWSTGRVVLLGDAPHATLPYTGQGANQAIEDAIVLADCLSTHKDYGEAFQSYFEQRSRRTRRIVNITNFMDKLHHAKNPLLVAVRDWFFASVVKGGFALKQLEKEIIEECPIKDYDKYRQ